MTSFYPGPSQPYPQVRGYLAEAYDSGILGQNHRSPAFVDLARQTVGLMKEKLAIPADYHVYFVSSATEVWEILAQSLAHRLGSLHLYNGEFGQKWAEHTQRLTGQARTAAFGLEEPLPVQAGGGPTLLCLTHNETSNATWLAPPVLLAQRAAWPGALVAADATSSLAGVDLPWAALDLVFASVQKCFGLPAGLAVLVASPRAVEAALTVGEQAHYNSLAHLHARALEGQTTHTPNVLGIFLLNRVLAQVPPIAQVAAQTHARARAWEEFLAGHGFRLLVGQASLRSPTVLAVQGSPAWVSRLKSAALDQGLLLGNGYGRWRADTFRIANFPALGEAQIAQLQDFLAKFGSE
jgi:phosphoserine aminotransferase